MVSEGQGGRITEEFCPFPGILLREDPFSAAAAGLLGGERFALLSDPGEVYRPHLPGAVNGFG